MAKRYGSFFLRCWHLDVDVLRFEIEHIQSGARTRVTSVAAAVDWIRAHDQPPEAHDDRSARPADECET